MRFLGVDTSTSRASVAITANGRLISENFHSAEAHTFPTGGHGRNNHAEVLLSLIDSTLRTAGVSLGELSGIAVAIGPGSFTGLRIGLSTIKGLSYGSVIPVIGVSTLHAWASRVSAVKGLICALLDARKNEVYGALFGRRDVLLERITADHALSIEQLVKLVQSKSFHAPVMFTGDGIKQYRELLLHSLGKQVSLAEDENLPTVASAVALIGEAAFMQGQGALCSSLTPQYVRRAEAEENARKLA
jgi:tRNA threonylcarbamoyladenosine biosynthesis protein TsaB